MHGSEDVAHLVDRHPTVTPERLIDQLIPPPTFSDVSFDTYKPDPAEPSQAAAVQSCRQFCEQAVARRAGKKKLFGRREALPGVGIYLDGGFGVGKTHLLAALWRLAPGRKYFGTFIEYTALVGALGYAEAVRLLTGSTLLAIDEFELDDPGDTMLMSRLLGELVATGTRIGATSNTPPNALGEGRFAASDFLREIQGLSDRFTTVRIEGLDYRRRALEGHARVADAAELDALPRASDVTVDDFDALIAHLATVHPARYVGLVEGVDTVGIREVHELAGQAEALRFVAFVDRLYDDQVRIVATGLPLDQVFGAEMLAGGYRKKYLRAMSRLVAMTAPDGPVE
jgi:cell division protein ZapE